jgi:DNA-binding MarR family transcriptional regulator
MTESHILPRLGGMGNSRRPRTANLAAAAALGLTDAIAGSIRGVTEMDLTAATALVALLDFTPGGTVGSLGQVVGVTHSGAVRLADRLVAAGYVDRQAGDDARSRRLTLTPAGVALAERVRAARLAATERVLGVLSAAERRALTTLSERLVEGVTADRLQQRAHGQVPDGGALCRLCDFTACGRPRGACPAAQTAAQTAAGRPVG